MVYNTNPCITIVVATYNASKTIRTALESIQNQDYQDWECLVVDGDSTDKTLDIVKTFQKKDNRFRYISEKDNGIYDAFNKGWKNAKGEWIYYLGADDELLPQGLLEISRYFNESSSIGVISGGVQRIRQDGTVKIIMSNGYIGSHQSMVMRRVLLENLLGFDLKYRIIADYDLFIRIKNSKYQVKNVDVIVANFYAGGTSEKLSKIYSVYKEKVSILKTDKYCRYPRVLTIKDCVKTIFGSLYHRRHLF